MSVLSDIPEMLKLEYKHIWIIISTLLGTICPGVLILFHFKPEIMEKYDVLKIACLSLALTLPLLVLNSLNSAIMFHTLPDSKEEPVRDPKKVETEKNKDITKGALLFNSMTLYLALAVCYLWSLSFKSFLGIVAGFELFWLFCGFCSCVIAPKSERRAN